MDAARFYRQEGGVKLANRFLDEFERVAKLLVEFPGIDMPADDFRRVHPLHDFPYSVIYRDVGGQIRILVVRGHLRDPEYGESRR
jgi:plasmid stabilization system protein ParE